MTFARCGVGGGIIRVLSSNIKRKHSSLFFNIYLLICIQNVSPHSQFEHLLTQIYNFKINMILIVLFLKKHINWANQGFGERWWWDCRDLTIVVLHSIGKFISYGVTIIVRIIAIVIFNFIILKISIGIVIAIVYTIVVKAVVINRRMNG